MSEWEHRVIKNIVWWRREGYAVETCLHGPVAHQSIQNYTIDEILHEMIRDSPHNSCRILSQTEHIDSSDNDIDA